MGRLGSDESMADSNLKFRRSVEEEAVDVKKERQQRILCDDE